MTKSEKTFIGTFRDEREGEDYFVVTFLPYSDRLDKYVENGSRMFTPIGESEEYKQRVLAMAERLSKEGVFEGFVNLEFSVLNEGKFVFRQGYNPIPSDLHEEITKSFERGEESKYILTGGFFQPFILKPDHDK